MMMMMMIIIAIIIIISLKGTNNRIPTFQSNAAASSSMVKMSKSNGHSSWTFRHLQKKKKEH